MKKALITVLCLFLLISPLQSLAEAGDSWVESSKWACDDMTVQIRHRQDAYSVVVTLNSNGRDVYRWSYHCKYDASSHTLTSTDGSFKNITLVHDTLANARSLYSDGKATFTLTDDGSLNWKDFKNSPVTSILFVQKQ